MFKSYKVLLVLISLNLVFNLYGQDNKKYQGLLWKISGNGLNEPSYLYGTMHVSDRVAFHLSETFFEALEGAEVIALETNPEFWVENITRSPLFKDYFDLSIRSNRDAFPLYTSFIPYEPKQNELEYYLSRDQDMLNNMLWRFSPNGQDFEEGTFLDLFIYQMGKKTGKEIVALEDFEDSFRSVILSNRYDKNAKSISERQAMSLLGDFKSWEELQEDAYRRGDLDLLDTLISSLYPGKYYRENMLDQRNVIMAEGMDSLMQTKRLFTGVGAAHLAGDNGVINLLRQKGYTVTAEKRDITRQSIDEKEEIDTLIYRHEIQDFRSADGFVETKVPGTMSKLVSGRYHEYLFADMANGAYYSLRRIYTSAPFYGKTENSYSAKMDSLFFENIPGKILSNEAISINGYPGRDIRNLTRQGDYQRYHILFTPLEILIFKAGGLKRFVESEQAQIFFNHIKLAVPPNGAPLYSPLHGGFELSLPRLHRHESYQGVYFSPYATFWAEALDEEGDHYAVAHRQYHDVNYIEEDAFELLFMAENLENEDDFILDTNYLIQHPDHPASAFRFHSKQGQQYYGQIHIKGPHYIALFTSEDDDIARQNFFSSFSFKPFQYADAFIWQKDTSMHYEMESCASLNNYKSFIEKVADRGDYQQREYHEKSTYRLLTYPPTGEQLEIHLLRLHRFKSFDSSQDLWDYVQEWNEHNRLIVVKDTLLFRKQDTTYYSEGREFWYSDTGSVRVIRQKCILENERVYCLSAVTDRSGYWSAFVQKAFNSFKTASDTVFGKSVLQSRSPLFFRNLYSRDSANVEEAAASIREIDFNSDDAVAIRKVVNEYTHPQFKSYHRQNLIKKLANCGGAENIDYLAGLYQQYADSAYYQIAILETLIDFKTHEALKAFKKLLLDEPPFSSNTWNTNGMIRGLYDSLDLAAKLYPELLELTDFEDYRNSIYDVLARLVKKGKIKGRNYRDNYSIICRRAKVELKKERSSRNNNHRGGNARLLCYNTLLLPFSNKQDVKEHFKEVLQLTDKEVLFEQVKLLQPVINTPDTIWNYLARDIRILHQVYDLLDSLGQPELLEPKFRTSTEIARSLVQNSSYYDYDTIAFIRSEKVEHKGELCTAHFFRVKTEKDEDLWTLAYVVMENGHRSKVRLAGEGEAFDPDRDDLDEILKDTRQLIKVDDRKRYVEENGNRW